MDLPWAVNHPPGKVLCLVAMLYNEAVKKPDFQPAEALLSDRHGLFQRFSLSSAKCAGFLRRIGLQGRFKRSLCLALFLLRISVLCQLLNVVDHAVQVPLRVD